MNKAVKCVGNVAEKLAAQDFSRPVSSPFPWRMEIDCNSFPRESRLLSERMVRK